MEIWTPRGTYHMEDHPELILLNRFAREIDPLLSIAVNRQTGDICLFYDSPAMGQKPVFGWQRVPSLDELQEKIYKADTWRHGDSILTDAWKHGEKVRKEAQRPVEEAREEAAERIEFEVRRGIN